MHDIIKYITKHRAIARSIALIIASLTILTSCEDPRSPIQRKHNVQLLGDGIDVNENRFRDVNNEQYNFKGLNGHMTLLAFWAPWCGYCAQEMPLIDKLKEHLTNRGYYVIPMVREEESLTEVENFYNRLQLHNIPPYISNDNDFYSKLGVNGYPSFVVVDKDGYAVAKMRPNWVEPDILHLFDEFRIASEKQGLGNFQDP